MRNLQIFKSQNLSAVADLQIFRQARNTVLKPKIHSGTDNQTFAMQVRICKSTEVV